mmetsp:Transcript_10971/g.34837  ORF Transcript_10971/g.34837 Transcript_10971/m.34837 type:complete len:227 (+) Transcript_10971:484-1164(+)
MVAASKTRPKLLAPVAFKANGLLTSNVRSMTSGASPSSDSSLALPTTRLTGSVAKAGVGGDGSLLGAPGRLGVVGGVTSSSTSLDSSLTSRVNGPPTAGGVCACISRCLSGPLGVEEGVREALNGPMLNLSIWAGSAPIPCPLLGVLSTGALMAGGSTPSLSSPATFSQSSMDFAAKRRRIHESSTQSCSPLAVDGSSMATMYVWLIHERMQRPPSNSVVPAKTAS